MAAVVCCGGCGGAPPFTVRGTSPAAPGPVSAPAVTPAQAFAIVDDYLTFAAAGDLGSAYGLWSRSWQSAHPEAAWAAGPPLPAGAAHEIGPPVAGADGSVYVPVRVGVSTAVGVRWANGGFTVGSDGGQARLLGGGLTPPLPPLDLQALAASVPGGGQIGTADCGGYAVSWSSRPGGAEGGFKSTLSIVGPDGEPVPAPPLPPFSFGTVPTACGDLFGDGGQELVLTTATTTAGAYRQAAVYTLGATGTRLIGQVPSVGDPAYPRPESPDGMYPYLMVGMQEIDDVGDGPILAPAYWADTGELFVRATEELPQILQADLAARLDRLRAGEAACAAPKATVPDCEATDLVVAYADAWELGQAAAGLAELSGLLPRADGAWMAEQAAAVAYNLRLP